MSDLNPPTGPPGPTRNRFAKIATISSILAPVVVILACILVFEFGVTQGWGPNATLSGSLYTGWFLAAVGVVLGVVGLVLTQRDRRKSLLVTAIGGICVNIVVILAPVALFMIELRSVPRGNGIPQTPQGRLDRALHDLMPQSTEEARFYALDDAAKESFELGKLDDAGKYATELLTLAPKFNGNWNYGNALQDGNLVLGRIALRRGQIEAAKRRLLAAGESPGSPQMDSFGPNVSLAKDLLEKGERDTVLKYFDLCSKFWKMDYGQLKHWSNQVNAGEIPEFGANLVY